VKKKKKKITNVLKLMFFGRIENNEMRGEEKFQTAPIYVLEKGLTLT
jgi:hypothetical protein